MEFEIYIRKNQISDWNNCYINFKIINKIITVLHRLNTRIHFKSEKYFVGCFSESEKETLKKLNKMFFIALSDQLCKFRNFLHYQIEMSLKPNLFKFSYNIQNMKEAHKNKIVKDIQTVTLRSELEKFYKDIHLIKSYLNLNLHIYDKLLSRYRNEFGQINMLDQDQLRLCNQVLSSGKVHKAFKKLESYTKVVSSMYIEDFHNENKFKQASDRLKIILTADQFSKSESFYFGFFIGCISLCMALCGALLIETDFFSYNPSEFVIYMVPIFRGTLALFIYIFFLGINVYGWETFNIDYKKILEIELHFSSSFKVIKRAFGFIAIWLVFFCYCAISNSNMVKGGMIFNRQLSLYMAPMPTFLFICYMIFPSKSVFNYEGRIWTFKVMKDILVEPFTKGIICFRTAFVFNQLFSFLILISDFVYTLCYMQTVHETGLLKNECRRFRFRFKQFFVIFVICSWWNIINLCKLVYLISHKKTYESKTYHNKIAECLKSCVRSVAMSFASVVGIYNYRDPILNATWLTLTIILCFWMNYNDIVMTWGLFQTKDFLRERLAYPNKNYYYLAIFLNFFLRCAWVIGLAPSLFDHPLLVNIMPLIMAIAECFRRMIWNFLTIEYQHLKIQGEFQFVNNYSFPYPLEIDMTNSATKMLVDRQVDVLLKGAFLKQDALEMEEIREPGKLNESMSKQSIIGMHPTELIIKTESEHVKDMEKWDESIEKCKELLRSKEVKSLGCGIVNLDLEMIQEAEGSIGNAISKPQLEMFAEMLNAKKALLVNKDEFEK